MLHHLPAYLDWLKEQDFSDATRRDYYYKLTKFAAWLNARPVELRVLDLRALRDYRNHLQKGDGGEQPPLRPRTIRVAFTAITSYCDYVRTHHPGTELPDPHEVRLPRLDAAQREAPTDTEVVALFRAADSASAATAAKAFQRLRGIALMHLFAYCGLRRAELLALNVEDLDMNAQPWKLYVRKGKRSETRWVPLNDECQAALAAWMAARESWASVHQPEPEIAAALFPVDRSRRIGNKMLDTWWDDLLSIAKVQRKITFHGLLHWSTSRVAKAEGLAAAQRFRGHKDIRTTFQYLQADDDTLSRAVSSIPLRPGGIRITEGGPGNVSQNGAGPLEQPRSRQEERKRFLRRER